MITKKYFILTLTFLCLLCGHFTYGMVDNEGDDENFCFECNNELGEVVIPGTPDSGDPCDSWSSAYDYLICHSITDSGDFCDPFSSSYNLSQCMGMEDSGDPCDIYSSVYDYTVCNGNNGEITNPEPNSESNITNEINDPCLKNAVNKVINGSSSNPFTTILKGDFYKQDNQSLTFSQYTDNSAEGIKTNGRLVPGNMYNQNIEVNLAALDNASQEFITATIYHEIIHAYMRSQGISNNNQHELMAEQEWRDKISSQLQIDYPSLSKTDADALAWGGLGDTSKWQTMYNNDITNNTGITGDLAAVSTNHKNLNNSTNGNYGTPCTN